MMRTIALVVSTIVNVALTTSLVTAVYWHHVDAAEAAAKFQDCSNKNEHLYEYGQQLRKDSAACEDDLRLERSCCSEYSCGRLVKVQP